MGFLALNPKLTAAYCSLFLFLSLRPPLPKRLGPGARGLADHVQSSKLTLPPQLAQQRQRAEQLLCLSTLGYTTPEPFHRF